MKPSFTSAVRKSGVFALHTAAANSASSMSGILGHPVPKLTFTSWEEPLSDPCYFLCGQDVDLNLQAPQISCSGQGLLEADVTECHSVAQCTKWKGEGRPVHSRRRIRT